MNAPQRHERLPDLRHIDYYNPKKAGPGAVIAHKHKQKHVTMSASASAAVDQSIVIGIEPSDDERTPLLLYDRSRSSGQRFYTYGGNQCERDGESLVPSASPSPTTPTLTTRKTPATADGRRFISGRDVSSQSIVVCDLPVVAFTLLLIAGITIATYLLIIETRLPSMGFALDLVDYSIWNDRNPLNPFNEGRLNHTNVKNVLVTQTGGSDCTETEECVRLLLELQETQGLHLPYNFLIGSDGLTYEVRGWDRESVLALLPSNATLVIGLLGNYTANLPGAPLLQSIESLLKESVRRRKLQSFYSMFGMRNTTISPNDGDALWRSLAELPRYTSLLQTV